MKIRVLHVLNSSSYSGAENVAISIINHTKDQVVSFYASLDGPIAKVLKKNNIEYYPMDKLNVHNLKKVINITKPDIIHAHDYTATIIAVLCLKKGKVISHLHNNSPWLKKPGFYSLALLFSSISVTKFITVSRSIENEYIFRHIIHNKILCISNPIDTNTILKKANEKDCFYKFDFIFLGRLTKPKNPELLLKIIENTVKIKNDIRIAIVGEGELYQTIKKRISMSFFSKNVTMFGFLPNPYPILKNCKALCLPSLWEGFGLVAVEALTLGVPVVCSGVGGLKDIVTNECGKICNQLDDYVIELTELSSNYVYWKSKHNKALIQAKQLDNSFEYYNKILEIYASLCRKENN